MALKGGLVLTQSSNIDKEIWRGLGNGHSAKQGKNMHIFPLQRLRRAARSQSIAGSSSDPPDILRLPDIMYCRVHFLDWEYHAGQRSGGIKFPLEVAMLCILHIALFTHSYNLGATTEKALTHIPPVKL